ncbi:MAG: saccharopine dehydrogenase [Deltaproteobacteria bacterium]|nr:MAG: saccharopine dehydrogenase [Deltaproteobacteria bacterium]
MTNARWMLYGANGYTGRLIAEVARRRGLSPVLAGRRREAIEPLAAEFGFDHRVVSLDDAAALRGALADVDALLLAAGPFARTSRPAVDACIATGTHYLDITGEIAVFEACAARSAEARDAGIALLPGVGFDVVPSDCLAASLAERLPGATELELAFAGSGGWSRGTAKTMVEGLGWGGAVRRDGSIVRVPAAHAVREVPFRDRPRTCVAIPWGDVSTAYHSTGIPNITVYMHMPRGQRRAIRAARPLLPLLRNRRVIAALQRAIERRVIGPSDTTRAVARSHLWGRASDGVRAVEGTLEAPEGYTLTAETAVESTVRLLAAPQTGFLTPSKAFGADYIARFDGCDLVVGDVQPAA